MFSPGFEASGWVFRTDLDGFERLRRRNKKRKKIRSKRKRGLMELFAVSANGAVGCLDSVQRIESCVDA